MNTAIPLAPGAGSDDGAALELDVDVVLDNVVELDRMLDESSRGALERLPVLELSKHMRVRATKPEAD